MLPQKGGFCGTYWVECESYVLHLELEISGLFFFVATPEKPIKCHLSGEDRKDQGEATVPEVMEVSGVDDEGYGDDEGGQDYKESYAKHEAPSGATARVVA